MFKYVNPFQICFQYMHKHSLLQKLYQNLSILINSSGTLVLANCKIFTPGLGQISELYDNPFWDFSNGGKKVRQ